MPFGAGLAPSDRRPVTLQQLQRAGLISLRQLKSISTWRRFMRHGRILMDAGRRRCQFSEYTGSTVEPVEESPMIKRRDGEVARDAGKEGGGAGTGYTIQALDTAISLLMLIADQPDLGLSALSRRLKAGKARVYRQLKTFEERGLVVCAEPNRSYRLGPSALMLGAKASRQIDLIAIARPFLSRLGEQVQETIQLRVLDGDETVCVASWEPARELHVQAFIGRRRPLYAGSSKTILAHMPEPERSRILSRKRVRITDNTIVDLDQLKGALDRIAQRGVGVSHGEVNSDLVSVAAPIFKLGGIIVGAINIAAPAGRMKNEQLALAIRLVKSAAEDLTAAIGGSIPGSSANLQS
jgi:IclR family transcriptional regulator, KDG regulon repressor